MVVAVRRAVAMMGSDGEGLVRVSFSEYLGGRMLVQGYLRSGVVVVMDEVMIAVMTATVIKVKIAKAALYKMGEGWKRFRVGEREGHGVVDLVGEGDVCGAERGSSSGVGAKGGGRRDDGLKRDGGGRIGGVASTEVVFEGFEAEFVEETVRQERTADEEGDKTDSVSSGWDVELQDVESRRRVVRRWGGLV